MCLQHMKKYCMLSVIKVWKSCSLVISIHLLNLDWQSEKQEMLITDSFAKKSENSINFHLHFKRYMCEKDNGIGSREEWMNIFGAKFAKQNLPPYILHNFARFRTLNIACMHFAHCILHNRFCTLYFTQMAVCILHFVCCTLNPTSFSTLSFLVTSGLITPILIETNHWRHIIQ